MSTSKHYPISASAAHRWVHCPGSIEFQKFFADNPSDAAERGTNMHAYAEAMLSGGTYSGPKLSQGDIDDVIGYVAFVRELSQNRFTLIEAQMEISPSFGGTLDFAAFDDDVLHVVDFKTGQVKVEAKDNPQLLTYGVGALRIAQREYVCFLHEIQLHIYQPGHGVSTATYTEDEFETASNRVLTVASEIANGLKTFSAGEHCKYCRAAYFCDTRVDYLGAELASIGSLTAQGFGVAPPEKVAYYALKVEHYKKELDALYMHAHGLALAGKPLPGTRLIEGRASRYYVDEVALRERLLSNGYAEAVVNKPPALIGITEMERLTGKKAFAEISQGLVDKKQAAPKLVAGNEGGVAYNAPQNWIEILNQNQQ